MLLSPDRSGDPCHAKSAMSKAPFGRRELNRSAESSALISMPAAFSSCCSTSKVSCRSWLPERHAKPNDALWPWQVEIPPPPGLLGPPVHPCAFMRLIAFWALCFRYVHGFL